MCVLSTAVRLDLERWAFLATCESDFVFSFPLVFLCMLGQRFRENEMQHGRWAMLAALGIIAVELYVSL